jgi:hypothetical protein
MNVKQIVEPLGLRMLRQAANVEVEIGIEGQENTIESVKVSESRNKRGDRILRIDFAADALPILVPKPLKHEPWWKPWLELITG